MTQTTEHSEQPPEEGAFQWPHLRGAGVPPAESRARRHGIQALALVAIALTVAWIAWRVLGTLEGAALWLGVPLILLEAHALLSLCFHALDLWNVDAAPRTSAEPMGARVAILIPTYNEPQEILLPTIAAAVAVEPAHETWVLDDGDRSWVAELASALGAHYRVRPDNAHAKAGNINAALPELEERGIEFVGVLDADHVAGSGFLTSTLPYFHDPRVAVVQTPQDFYNQDSFEHIGSGPRAFSEQALFYRALAAGRNRWDAAFWCGTCAVVRLDALLEVGGVATESVTEDILTTLKMHRRGWTSVYHNEVVAQGLAATNAEQYLTQRVRWGTGAMQVLRRNNPMGGPGLTLGQRLSYLSTLTGWFDAWRTLGYVLIPLLTIAFAAMPVAAPARVFLPLFALVWCVQRVALTALDRGRAPLRHALLFEFIRMPANLRSTLTLLRVRDRPFVVTSKGRDSHARTRLREPMLLRALLLATPLVLAWGVLVAFGLTPLHYDDGWVPAGAAFWAVVNGFFLLRAVQRIRAAEFGANRRAAVRFEVSGPAEVDGQAVRVRDLSLTGARVVVSGGSGLAVGHQVRVCLPVSYGAVTFTSVVRRVQGFGAEDLVGIEFVAPERTAQAALALALFETGVAPDLDLVEGTTPLVDAA
jgi:cellulose synthase/poly-beta-1,6-N-acetylglucosamine synthase-like glycosyltransferase